MREIPLQAGRGVALVDDDDYERLSRYRWYLVSGYAQRAVRTPGGMRYVFMHVDVCPAKREWDRDHINRNKLDNRKANLRVVPRWRNNRNSGLPINNTSGYRGVDWQKKDGKWRARTRCRGVDYHLGYFETAEQAAAAYRAFDAKLLSEEVQ